MNLRTHKRMRYAQVSHILVNAYWQRVIDTAMEKALAFTPEELAEQAARNAAFWAELEKSMAQRQLVEEPAADVDAFAEANKLFEAPEPRYSVAKKSTGEIVATGLDIGAAEAMIQKAKSGKKAALVLA